MKSEALIAALEHRNELRAKLINMERRHAEALAELEFTGEQRTLLKPLIMQREFEIQNLLGSQMGASDVAWKIKKDGLAF